MKLFKVVGGIFAIIGFAALAALAISIMNTNKFISSSVVTQGEVSDIVIRTSKDSDGNTTRSRFPVVRFQDQQGNSIEFESSTSTSSGTSIGQPVEVRYLPQNPQKARISSSFMDMWGLSVIFGIFGVAFAGLGIPFFWLGIKDDLNEKKALTYSKEIQATITGVSQNQSISVNGRHPFRIEAQWHNPDTNEMHIFFSKNFWYNPSGFLKDTILVKADPHNFKKYWMDVSALPKKA